MEYMGWQVNNYYNNIAPYIGKEVILIDRFLPSCFAYNALRPDPYSMTFVNIMDKLLKNFFVPDVTFWIDVDDDTLSKRHQSTDQPEKMTDLSFMRFVRSEYDRFCKTYATKEVGPYYVKKLSGTDKIGDLVDNMLKVIAKRTGNKLPERSTK
jgi:thymidylate kinase